MNPEEEGAEETPRMPRYTFSWERCPVWQEGSMPEERDPPWRDPRPNGFRYFSITEIEEVLRRGNH